jgi:hypothetical protein
MNTNDQSGRVAEIYKLDLDKGRNVDKSLWREEGEVGRDHKCQEATGGGLSSSKPHAYDQGSIKGAAPFTSIPNSVVVAQAGQRQNPQHPVGATLAPWK